jgi:DNA-directed RNA polymerase subunit RPC12/RpoP
MKYTCTRCGGKVVTSDDKQNIKRHKARGWRCPLCYTIIFDEKYKRNIPGALTLFSPMDSMMGDRVVLEGVLRYYRKQNPDEMMELLGFCDPKEVIRNRKPTKFFWASTTNMLQCPDHKSIIRYNVAREACALATKGVYPALWFRPKRVDLSQYGRYVCLSVRNIDKAAFKNAEPYIVNRLWIHLDKLVREKKIDSVVIIGVDLPLNGVYEPTDERWVFDMRGKLKLQESAYILKHAALTVGKDTGTMHLASAAGSPVVAWGYTEPDWRVKAPAGKAICLMKDESRCINIMAAIDKMIGEVKK